MNRFHLGATSGIIAASLAANSVLFAFRNSHASKHLFISQILVKWRTVTGYDDPQEIRIAVLPVTSFASTNYTGGTDLSNYTGGSPVLATNAIKPRSKDRNNQRLVLRSCLETGNIRIATTAGLSHAGSPTIATHPWMDDSVHELDNASAPALGAMDLGWEATGEGGGAMVDYEGCWPIPADNGFVITNPIALGAGGTGRLIVEIDWLES